MPPPHPPRIRVLPRGPSKRLRLNQFPHQHKSLPEDFPEEFPAAAADPSSSSRSSIWSKFTHLFSGPSYTSSSRPRIRPPRVRSRTVRSLQLLIALFPIGIFLTEHIAQVMWVRGPSMSPCLNEGYEYTNTESDMVLVNMLPFKAGLRTFGKKRTRLERGMIVTFWYGLSL